MKTILNKLYLISKSVVHSIAFYPGIIFIFCIILAIFMLKVEDDEFTKFMYETIPFLVIEDTDNARTIMGTLIGGIISLTVFSFSMVMILLNQASSNFSPRLLPGLISDRKNQIVLGAYLGTIVYNIIILISVSSSDNSYAINGFSILIGIMFGIFCLGLFVFFIHTISTNIQIDNILKKIFNKSKNRLQELISIERNESLESNNDMSDWYTICSENAGYYYGIDHESILDIAEEMEINISIIPHKGKYLLPKMPIAKVDKELDKNQIEDILDLFTFSVNTDSAENFVLGIKQITEVGVKAMSPGINDPGTAVMTIDYLTELFSLRMQLDDKEVYHTSNKKFKIDVKTVDFENLIYQSMASYRQYCKHDMILIQKIIMMFKYLLNQECKNEKYKDVLRNQIEILKEDFKSNINNSFDCKKIEKLLAS